MERIDSPWLPYPHVLKATLIHSAWHRCVSGVVAWLPSPVQRLIRWIWPRYGLPDCVILKKLRKPEHVEAFENEKTFYRRLAAAQGDLIPRYYGEAVCDGDRTNVIEYLPWPTVRGQPLPRMSAETFAERITVAMDELARYGGVYYDDAKLNNILLADDGRIRFIDLEGLVEPEPGDDAFYRMYTIRRFNNIYKDHLKIRSEMEAEGETDDVW